jgi:hypothetical protein
MCGLFDILCLLFEMRSCHVAQAGLKLAIYPPQSPKGWRYRHSPPYSALSGFFVVVLFCFMTSETSTNQFEVVDIPLASYAIKQLQISFNLNMRTLCCGNRLGGTLAV